MGPGEEHASAEDRLVHCKDYHRSKTRHRPGIVRHPRQRKSVCPSWAMDERLQIALIRCALLDSGGACDLYGRPKRLWNAVSGVFFVGVSCNVETSLYNCYPETPPDGKHFGELLARAKRTPEEAIHDYESGDDAEGR
jgi:hypothetical protein